MAEVKLAEALLRRKELQQRVDVLKDIDAKAFYEVKAQRIKVTDNLEDVTAHVPKLTASQVMSEINHYSRQLRLIDAAIQQANWTTEIDASNTMEDYEVEVKEAK